MNIRALLGNTKSKVFEIIKTRRHTASEVATKLDVQVNAARKHLESLKSKGLVKEEYVNNGVGRPKKFYSLTGAGYDLLHNQCSTILNLLLSEMEKHNGKAGVENAVKQIAMEVGTSMRDVGLDRIEQIESLASSLDQFGFESRLERGEGSQFVAITSQHCPLQETVTSHQRLVCHGFHDQIIKSALGTDKVRLDKCMALGDKMCRHVISGEKEF